MSGAEFHQDFWRALWRPDPTNRPWTRQPGLAVYRNTVWKACIDSLVANHPAVRRLVGDDWLRAVAQAHVQRCPPDDPRLMHYGDGFDSTLAQALSEDDTHLIWLPDVAQLDRLWITCHTAADAAALAPQALARLSADELPHTRLVPHPAARWHWCADWPAFSLWQAAREAHDDPNPPHWQGQGTLLTRPDGAVQASEIPLAACVLLQACADGSRLPDAITQAQALDPAHDLGATLALLLAQGAFTTLSRCTP